MVKTIFVILCLFISTEKITYSNKGTRSEITHHWLYIHNIKIPDIFTTVGIIKKRYLFKRREYPWGEDGYIRKKELFSYKKINLIISKDDIEKGFYLLKDRKKGTPYYWLYFERDNYRGWVAPESIYKLQDNLKLMPISRMIFKTRT